MGHDFIFVPLDKNPNVLAPIRVEQVRKILARFDLNIPIFVEGSNDFGLCTPPESPHEMHEEALLVVNSGNVASFSIARPCMGSRPLWFALIVELGFVMIPTYGGMVFANAQVARELEYLSSDRKNFPEGVHIVKSEGDLP